MDNLNYTMLCDFYELTMGNGYFASGMHQQICYFDVFFRQVPFRSRHKRWSYQAKRELSLALPHE